MTLIFQSGNLFTAEFLKAELVALVNGQPIKKQIYGLKRVSHDFRYSGIINHSEHLKIYDMTFDLGRP